VVNFTFASTQCFNPHNLREMQSEQHATVDIRSLGITRSMDIIKYVLYSGDEKFVHDMVTRVTHEAADEQNCEELRALLNHKDQPLMYKCLFFLMLYFQPKFRYWTIDPQNGAGLQPICPYKVRCTWCD
jgi:hypothetical protein